MWWLIKLWGVLNTAQNGSDGSRVRSNTGDRSGDEILRIERTDVRHQRIIMSVLMIGSFATFPSWTDEMCHVIARYMSSLSQPPRIHADWYKRQIQEIRDWIKPREMPSCRARGSIHPHEVFVRRDFDMMAMQTRTEGIGIQQSLITFTLKSKYTQSLLL